MFTSKRREFIAKYLSDISKLFFAASVVKQFIDQVWSVQGLLAGSIISLVVFGFAIILHPKE